MRINLLLVCLLISMISITKMEARSILTDTISVVQVEPSSVSGEDNSFIWDFSNVDDTISHDVFLYQDTIQNTMLLQKLNCLYKYQLHNDTLFHLGYETNHAILNHQEPIPHLVYPLHVGDSISGSWNASGEYGHLLSIGVEGKYFSIVDAIGKLRLPHREYDNVYRIRTTKQLSVSVADTSAVVISEYQWLQQWGLFPLFEMCEVRTINGHDTLTSQVASYCLSDDMILPQYGMAEVNRPIGSEEYDIHIWPIPVIDELLVSFVLINPEPVAYVLHNRQGLVMYHHQLSQPICGEVEHRIPMGGLPSEDYVLDVHIGNSIQSKTIIKL